MSEGWLNDLDLDLPVSIQKALENSNEDIIWNLSNVDERDLTLNAKILRELLVHIISAADLRVNYHITGVIGNVGELTSFVHDITFNVIEFSGEELTDISFQININPGMIEEL